MQRAAEAGLAAIALTDHDTTGGLEEALEAGRRLGVEVVPGIELSASLEGREVHLLGYFIRREDARLSERLASLQSERAERIERIVARLNEQKIPVTIEEVRSFAGGQSVGRPHVADALVSGGFVPSYEIAWRDYLSAGGKAYVERTKIPLPEAISLVHACGGVVSVAHPTLNLGLDALENVAGLGVDALETVHPRVTESEARALGDLCRRRGLLESGGSDCHGDRRGAPTMGLYRVPLERLDALRRLARG